MPILKPLRFTPLLREVIWGGDTLYHIKDVPVKPAPIGESWEVSVQPGMVSVVDGGQFDGQPLDKVIAEHKDDFFGKESELSKFPLLIKFIDARQDLSVQVHPNDEQAQRIHGCNGKTEMWHVIAATDDAKIYAGLDKPLDPAKYAPMAADGSIMKAVKAYDSSAGDTFYLPAGTIHAIGAGNLIAEIQQDSNITYRVYDYNRGRELHTAQAAEVINFNDTTPCKVPSDKVESPYFTVRCLDISGEIEVKRLTGSYMVIMCLSGEIKADNGHGIEDLKLGTTLLYPASALGKGIKLSGSGKVLIVE